MPNENLPVYLREDEAARVLRVSRSEVSRLIEQGVIPSIKLGRHIRIPRDKLLRLEDYLERQRIITKR